MVIDPASNLNHQKNRFSFFQVNWTHTFLVVTIHLLGLFALSFWPRPIDLLLFLVWYLATTLAIGVGYHRLLTHRGFISPRWMRWLGLLTLGEGWHNNHHARPAAAIHGWRWWEVDISGYVIRTLARLGLIRNVVREPRTFSDGRI